MELIQSHGTPLIKYIWFSNRWNSIKIKAMEIVKAHFRVTVQMINLSKFKLSVQSHHEPEEEKKSFKVWILTGHKQTPISFNCDVCVQAMMDMCHTDLTLDWKTVCWLWLKGPVLQTVFYCTIPHPDSRPFWEKSLVEELAVGM